MKHDKVKLKKMSDAYKHVEKRNAAWILGYILKPGSHPGTVENSSRQEIPDPQNQGVCI